MKLDLFMDGDQWCVTRQDFVNLQESPVGFGLTPNEATNDLLSRLTDDEYLKEILPPEKWNCTPDQQKMCPFRAFRDA